jgi:hypothetical protein
MSRFLTPDVNFSPATYKGKLLNNSQSTIRMGADRLLRTVADCGFSGVELHGVRSLHLLQLALGTPAGRRLASGTFSVHQSWNGVGEPKPNSNRYPRRTNEDAEHIKDSRFSSWATKAIFLKGDESLRLLQRKLSKLGRSAAQLTHVIYPDISGDADVDRQTAEYYPNAAFELTADILASWNVHSPEELVAETRARRLKAAANHVHMTRKGKTVDAAIDQQEYLPALIDAGLVPNITFGFFRNDFAKVDIERVNLSYREGAALINQEDLPTTEQTAGRGLATTLKILKDHNWRGNVTISAPLSGMARHLGDGCETSYDTMVYNYRRLVSGVREQMSWIPDDYWQPMPGSLAA